MQFIGTGLRLRCWRTASVSNTPAKPEHVPLLPFYMGKNTPERKDYIMDKLAVPVEEKPSARGVPPTSG